MSRFLALIINLFCDIFSIMRSEVELRHQVAKNLLYYRKLNNLTQSSLAKKLNYSDKAVSKWERGETLPDVYILSCLAELYGVSLTDLTSFKPPISLKEKNKSRFLISICSIMLVWLIATIIFISFVIVAPHINKSWLSFIYAIPISLIVGIVFSCLWGSNNLKTIVISLFAWSIPLSICLTFSFSRLWFLFICVIPFQILILLWFKLKDLLKRRKKIKESVLLKE